MCDLGVMFRKTEPQQELFKVDAGLPESLQKRLRGTWASVFQREILPVLMDCEEQFAILYGAKGRPNFSTGRMLGLCLLQEFNNLSDQAALDAFGFDVRWQYALDVTPEKAYLSRRSLVEFRSRLVQHDPEMLLMRNVFEKVSKAAILKLELSVSEQRLDSTQITSNISRRGRLDLFRKTLTVFLRSLDEERFALVPADIQKWFHDVENSSGWFGLEPAAHQAKLVELARCIHRLLSIFKEDEVTSGSEPYQLLKRLFDEHCETKGSSNQSPTDTDNSQDKRSDRTDNRTDDTTDDIIVKKGSEGASLQSPYDPDASCGHKGPGYSVHVSETCNNKNKPEIITDYEVHGAARSDVAKTPDILRRLEAAELKPDTMFADGGYPTPPSTLDIIANGVELIAPVHRGKLAPEIMSRSDFSFDAQGQITACPAGHAPLDHRERSAQNTTEKAIHAIFDGDQCRHCEMLEKCPVRAPNNRKKGCSQRDTKGNFRLEVPESLVTRDRMFALQQTPEWKERYKIRSGVEATMSELKRCHGLAKLRVRRLPRVQFAVICKVTACNIRRWAAFAMLFCLIYTFCGWSGFPQQHANASA